jgi:hypothetical protein
MLDYEILSQTCRRLRRKAVLISLGLVPRRLRRRSYSGSIVLNTSSACREVFYFTSVVVPLPLLSRLQQSVSLHHVLILVLIITIRVICVPLLSNLF